MESRLLEHADSGCRSFPNTYADQEELSLRQQYDVLSSLPNNHAESFINEHKGNISEGKGRQRRTAQFRAYQSQAEQHNEDILLNKRPTSFRNRLIYFINNYNAQYISVMLRFHYDKAHTISSHSLVDNNEVTDVDEFIVRDRIQGQASRTHNVGSISGEANTNMSTPVTLFHCFKGCINEGTIQWRYHSEERDIIVMNDYHTTSGNLIPNSFVHVYIHRYPDGTSDHRCTCSAFKDNYTRDSSSPMFYAPCLHCRYFKELVDPLICDLFNDVNRDTFSFQMIQKSLSTRGLGVVALSVKSDPVRKFSVVSILNQNYSFVHLSSENNLSCQETACQIGKRHKRKDSIHFPR